MTTVRIEKKEIESIIAKNFNINEEKVRLLVYYNKFEPDDIYAELEIDFNVKGV